MEDFNCLSELGRFSRDREAGFLQNVTSFFWQIATAQTPSSLEVMEHCSKKYRDIIKYNCALDKKQEMIFNLIGIIRENKLEQSVACMTLLEGIIKDQSERSTSSNNSYNYTYSTGVNSYPSSGGYGTGSALRYTGGTTSQNKVGSDNEDKADEEKD